MAEQDAAHAAAAALRREVADARPRTIPGLLAKIAAISEDWGAKTLEQDTTLEDGKVVALDTVLLTVLRDCKALLGAAKPT